MQKVVCRSGFCQPLSLLAVYGLPAGTKALRDTHNSQLNTGVEAYRESSPTKPYPPCTDTPERVLLMEGESTIGFPTAPSPCY